MFYDLEGHLPLGVISKAKIHKIVVKNTSVCFEAGREQKVHWQSMGIIAETAHAML